MSTTSNVSFDNCEQLNLYDDVYMHLRNRDVHNSHESLHTNVMPYTTFNSHVHDLNVKHAIQ